LIWKRMVASQMASAEFDQVAVDIDVDDGTAGLRANGSIMSFDGFLRLYQEGRDDQEGDRDGDRRLPKMSEGERHTRDKVLPEQHFTKPPPRYGEASLGKRMEELGIGRPSTYASILQVLQDRDYVRLDKRRFVPQDRGRIVIAFLSSFFQRYVQYNFTADLEKQLDDISGGRVDWKTVLRDFWAAFSEAVAGTKDLSITAVIDALDEALGPHFFPLDPENPDKDPRACPACGDGRLGLRLGRSGGFIGCSNYPDCGYTRQLALLNGEEGAEAEFAGPRQLGEDPETGKAVTLRKGPFGIYVQLGEPEGKAKPKRSSLPKGMTPDEVSLEKALALLALPREVGRHPESGEAITAGLGRYGPYVKHQSTYRSLSEGDDVLSIGLNRAVALIAEAPARRKGRFGPYVKHGKVYASLPKDMDPDSVTLDQAVELLAAKAEKQGSKPAAKKSRTKPAAKKKAPAKKKPAAKKKPPTTKATR
jgi:DNA topoisomerase-1